MYRSVKILMLVLAVGAMLAICAPYDSTAHVNQPAGGKFTGVPRDVDFIKNSGWTQVILQGSDELVAQTKNECIEGIVLVAFSMKSEITVGYVEGNPKMLTSVTLSLKGEDEEEHVRALSFDDKEKKCWATVFKKGEKVNVWTRSAQMQNILETAVRQSIPVKEFTYDQKTKEITRGKVNVELGK
jgi:hypothetical protein